MLPIYYNRKEELYFIEGQQVCSSCNIVLNNLVFVQILQYYQKVKHTIFCADCIIKRSKGHHHYESIIQCLATSEAPARSQTFIYRPIQIGSGKIQGRSRTYVNTWIYEESKDKGEGYLIDNTRHAGRESLEGAQIGARIEEEKLLKNETEVSEFLEYLGNAKPLIESKEKKMLTEK